MELFSTGYQKRLVEGFAPQPERVAALRGWGNTLRAELANPRGRQRNETALREQFFSEVFVAALGYGRRASGKTEWTLDSEYPTEVDATRPDGVLGFLRDQGQETQIDVVIELRGLNTDLDLRQNRRHDRRTPVDQAFGYAHKYDHVQWVIVSNYRQLRLYHRNSSKYSLHFDLLHLIGNGDSLKLFFLLLARENLIAQGAPSPTDLKYASRQRELRTVSDRFYQDYKQLRAQAVRAIRQEHPQMAAAPVVQLAQTLLDRMLFVVFLESTGQIPEGRFSEALRVDPYLPRPLWERVQTLFAGMDQGNSRLGLPPYNGGLFRQNQQIQALKLEDGLLRNFEILARYDYQSDLRVNILGHVFEQSISDLENLKTELLGSAAEDTRRHDEGAYYTPEFITEYIVERTIAPQLEALRGELGEAGLPLLDEADRRSGAEGRPTRQAQKHITFWEAYLARLQALRVLDPSCGSGAFLVAAFDYLNEENSKAMRELAALNAPQALLAWRNSELLKHNLYGVDISHEAVEITRLSLWLKIAGNREPLVSLDQNIRAGNAVIADPACDAQNAFDWQQAFPEVQAAGGFDVVLGNPPYVRHERITAWKPALAKRFETYTGTADLYVYFYELGYTLLKPGGRLGYIASNKFMRTGYGHTLRRFLSSKTCLEAVLDLGQRDDLFPAAITYPAIVLFQKSAADGGELLVKTPPFHAEREHIPATQLGSENWSLKGARAIALKQKMQAKGTPLKEWPALKIHRGMITGYNRAFFIDAATRRELVQADPRSAEVLKPLLRGRDLEQWHVQNKNRWLIFIPSGWTNARRKKEAPETFFKAHLPAIYTHLTQVGSKGKGKGLDQRDDQGDYWWELRPCAYCEAFEMRKIIYPILKSSLAFHLDAQGFYHNDKAFHIVGENLPYMAAVLNSSLAFWFLKNSVALSKGETMELRQIYMREFPMPQATAATMAHLAGLAETLTELHARREQLRLEFVGLLVAEHGAVPSKALLGWPTASDFGVVLRALAKGRFTLPHNAKAEWRERFIQGKAATDALALRSAKEQAALNAAVEDLYGLTREERRFYKGEHNAADNPYSA